MVWLGCNGLSHGCTWFGPLGADWAEWLGRLGGVARQLGGLGRQVVAGLGRMARQDGSTRSAGVLAGLGRVLAGMGQLAGSI